MFSFIIRFLKTKTNRDNQNLYWLKSNSSIKFIVYLGQEVKKNAWKFDYCWSPGTMMG